MLTIALLGDCPVQLSELAAALKQATQALDRQTMLVTAAGADALPTGLPGFDLVLLAGLEAPYKAVTDLHAATDPEAKDHLIRAALARAGVAYRVLYGTSGERLAHALQAVESLRPSASRPRQATRPERQKNQSWIWMCDKCSDPQCEHLLLTALLASRDSAASTPSEQARHLLNR
ncbi:FIG00933054: hypothetical protein [Polaromonas sp. CG9_12]|nr:FIG00933054: hypothetical protein [Polaromonas sp. CG9_12]